MACLQIGCPNTSQNPLLHHFVLACKYNVPQDFPKPTASSSCSFNFPGHNHHFIGCIQWISFNPYCRFSFCWPLRQAPATPTSQREVIRSAGQALLLGKRQHRGVHHCRWWLTARGPQVHIPICLFLFATMSAAGWNCGGSVHYVGVILGVDHIFWFKYCPVGKLTPIKHILDVTVMSS